MDLALNNLQRLICHKTPTNKQASKQQMLGTAGEVETLRSNIPL